VADELARPGVEVIQEFRTVTPSIITPTLVPNVLGVAKQIVEVQIPNGSGGVQLNPNALVVMPAFFIAAPGSGNPLRYTGLGGLLLVISANESPDITLVFSDPTAFGLTPATVVDQINKQLAAQLVTSVVAETVGADTWQLRTVGVGEFQSIAVVAGTSPVVASTFGLGIGQTYLGLTSYNQYAVVIPPTSLPDPNNNLDELAVEASTVRVFLSTGSGGLQEALRTSSFLSRGEVSWPGQTTEGTVNLTGPFPFFSGQVIWVRTEVGEIQVVAIPATVNTSAQLLALLNGMSGLVGITASLGAGNGLVLTRSTGEGGQSSFVEILQPDVNSANLLLGLTPQKAEGVSIAVIDDGNGDAISPLVQFDGLDFTTPGGTAVLSGGGAVDFPLLANTTLVLSDGGQPQTIDFGATPPANMTQLKAAIEAVVGPVAGGNIVVTSPSPNLILTNTLLGDQSFVQVIGGTALPKLDSGTTVASSSEGSVSLNPNLPATTTEGTVNLADGITFPVLGTQTFSINIGGGPILVTLASEATFAALKANIEGTIGLVGQIVVTRASGTTGGMVIKTVATGGAATITVTEGTGAAALLGLALETVLGVTVFPTIAAQTFSVDVDGAGPTLVTLASETNFAAVKANIEGVVTDVVVTQGPNGGIVISGDGTSVGVGNTIEIIEGAGGAALLGLPVGTVFAGNGELIVAGASANGAPFPPAPGDQLYIDGVYFADITKVAPGGLSDVLRINRQVPIDVNIGQYFYLVAKNLVAGDPLNGVTRPFPDLIVDGANNLLLKPNQLRDIRGVPVPSKAPLYVAYSAVRQDVTALAAQPGLLRFNDTLSLEQTLSPINTDNPLALGLFFALVNAPGIEVTGLGVDAVSADAPYGTVEAFTRAFEYLESFEVYAIAPLTHDQTVAQVANTHVNFMSSPTQKGERITLWNPETPTREVDKLVASGTDGDALTTVTFDTKVAGLSALLNNAGVNPVGIIPTTAGVFLDIAGDDSAYSVESISGGVVTIRTLFQAGTNDDSFYSTTPLSLPIISTAFAIRVRGSELVTTAGTTDKPRVATTVAALGKSFQNRRFWMTFPDACGATIEGLEQRIEGFYMNAAIVGMIGQQPPQQSFTNYPMAGFTRVFGSNDTFSESQLNQMAAGGAYVIVQDTPGAPLTSRMALTTDLTSIETRTDSITKVVDFTAKFMRRGLRNFIGRFNITQGFLDTLGSVIQGLGGFLVETGVLIGLTLNNLVQDEDARDTVLVDCTLDPPYPCNYIRLTLVV
jgi:hypothetical protein